jgi:cell division protein FtsN
MVSDWLAYLRQKPCDWPRHESNLLTMPRRKAKRKKTQTSKPQPTPGWIWMFIGLAVGLSVAAAIYVKDRQPREPQPAAPAAAPARPEHETKGSTPPEEPSSRFEFYEMLPNFEVVIPEEDRAVLPELPSLPVEAPGIYVLQAGSFSSYPDADRMKAKLALLGVVSRIQKVSIDDKVYHRVRIGPVDSLDRLNSLRQQLRQAQIEAIVIRVGE